MKFAESAGILKSLIGVLLLAGCVDAGPGLGLADAGAMRADLAAQADPDLSVVMPPDQATTSMCKTCAKFGLPQARGVLPSVLKETSGLAASRAHPGILYAHNDSGSGAQFYAISETGVLVATIHLPGVSLEDPEDIDVGPCPSGTCVYLGDIGDNNHARAMKKIVRVAEPSLAPSDLGKELDATQIETLPFSYPAGARHNAETLLVHPQSGDIYVATKEDPGVRSTLYKFPQPLTPGRSVVLTRVALLPIPKSGDQDLSAGDIHPCGNAVLFRTGNRLYLLPLQSGQPFESVFSPPSADAPFVLDVPAAMEANAESASWNAAGTGYFTTSEGTAQPLHAVDCVAF